MHSGVRQTYLVILELLRRIFVFFQTIHRWFVHSIVQKLIWLKEALDARGSFGMPNLEHPD